MNIKILSEKACNALTPIACGWGWDWTEDDAQPLHPLYFVIGDVIDDIDSLLFTEDADFKKLKASTDYTFIH